MDQENSITLSETPDPELARVLNAVTVPERPADRTLRLPRVGESFPKQLGFLLLALGILFAPRFAVKGFEFPGGYLSWMLTYNAPAHPGVDQNGYQVGGKYFADTFSTGYKPANNYEYIGWMWVMTDDGWYYPKYPLGLPVIDAILIWIGGRERGIDWAYQVSPVSISLAMLAMFLLVRQVAGSFAGIVSMLLLGASGATLLLANNSNSHAPCLAFVCWGMVFLLWWWQSSRWWQGLIAGLLLGYAVTIRYTEGLLLLPLLFACLSKVRWKSPRSYLRSAVPVLGWMIPCLLLVGFNLGAMGTITGYDTTNESTGFSWTGFADKWQFMLDQLHDFGLYFVFPLAILGLLLLTRWNWMLGTMMLLWFVPGVLLYTAYYWGPRTQGVSYLRFFLTLFPPAVFAAGWLLNHVDREKTEVHLPWRRSAVAVALTILVCAGATAVLLWKWPEVFNTPGALAVAMAAGLIPAAILGSGAGVVRPIAAGVLLALSAGLSVKEQIGALERDLTIQTNLSEVGARVYAQLPQTTVRDKRPIVFADGRNILNYLQFKGDYECYSPDAFTQRAGMRRVRNEDPEAPNPLQRARIELARQIYEKAIDEALQKEAQRIILDALKQGRRVYALQNTSQMNLFKRRFVTEQAQFKLLQKWTDPVSPTEAARAALTVGPRWFGADGRVLNWELIEITLKP